MSWIEVSIHIYLTMCRIREGPSRYSEAAGTSCHPKKGCYSTRPAAQLPQRESFIFFCLESRHRFFGHTQQHFQTQTHTDNNDRRLMLPSNWISRKGHCASPVKCSSINDPTNVHFLVGSTSATILKDKKNFPAQNSKNISAWLQGV